MKKSLRKCFISLLSVFMLFGLFTNMTTVSAQEGEETNLALNKPVSDDGGANPEYVTDGDTGSEKHWDGGVGPASFVIDLQDVSYISKLKVFPFQDGKRYYHYEVYTSLDDKDYKLAAEKKDDTMTPETGDEYIFNEKLHIRYIKVTMIQSSLNGYVHMSEVEAYGEVDSNYEIDKEGLLVNIVDTPPTISADNKLIMPEIESDKYEVKLHGSSNESVIGLDGTVYTPLEAMNVSVMYSVVNKSDPTDNTFNRKKEVTITVPGKYDYEEGDNARPAIVPGIREWKGQQGNFVLTNESRLVIADSSLHSTADMIAYYFKEMLGRDIAIVSGTPNNGDIYLTLNGGSELGEEGYYLEIGDIVNVSAYKPKGILYSGTTLTQILMQDSNYEIIPKGIIRDYPEYETRSAMFDVARFYVPIDYLEEMTKYMAFYKMNEIHVHINDDGGEQHSSFRIESKLYPEINQGIEVYTQEEYKNYQKEVKNYGINVITEIDTPGHTSFVGLYDPSFILEGSGNMDIRNRDAVEFVKDVYDELLDGDDPVIQSDIVHVGCDEYLRYDERFNEYREEAVDYYEEIINHVKSKGYKVRMWNMLGSEVYPGVERIETDVEMNYFAPFQANYGETLEKGFPIINSWCDWLYVVPGFPNVYGTEKALIDIYNNWEVTNLGDGFIVPNATPELLGAAPCYWYDFKGGFSEFDGFQSMKKMIMIGAEKTWYGEKTEGQSGEEFLNRIDNVSSHAPGANPQRYVKSNTNKVVGYDFEDIQDNIVKDSSGNNYDGELHNLKTSKDDGNNVLKLDGKGYLSLPFDSLGYPYTVSFDLYIDKDTPSNAVLFDGEDGTLYLNYNDSGKIVYERKGYTYIFDYPIQSDKWHNILIMCDDKHTSLYVDGTLVANGEYYKVDAAKFLSSTFVLPAEEVGKGVIGKLDNLELFNDCFALSPELAKGENLAVNKPVTVSGLEVNDGRYTAEMAVDDDYSTWVSLHYQDEAWVIVDLEQNCYLEYLEIEWRERPNKYEVYISEDGEKWTKVFEDLECEPRSNGTETIQFTKPTQARYIKYQQLEMFSIPNEQSYSGNFFEFRAIGMDYVTILNDAKQALAELSENKNASEFIRRFTLNVERYEEKVNSGDYTNLAWIARFIREQTAMLRSGEYNMELADVSKLESLTSENLNKDDYLENTFDKYQGNIELGKRVLFNIQASQGEVDIAVRWIENSKKQLIAKTKTALLEEKIKEAEAINLDNYTEDTALALSEEIKKAKKLLEIDPSQEEVDQAVKDLDEAIDGLKLKDGIVDTSVLKELIAYAKSINMDLYTDESVKVLSDTIEEAESLLAQKSISQTQVDEMVNKLNAAIDGLKRKEEVNLDKEKLEKLITRVEELDASRYTKESVENLNKVLENAKTVLISAQTQEELDKAYERLMKAMNDLKLIGSTTDKPAGIEAGDSNHVLPYIALLALAAISLYVVKEVKRKRKNNK